ncbi:MAG: arylsulfatase [Chloroflexi bacterium]|nr:arylsulfatase [Chloroflexota bacterium]
MSTERSRLPSGRCGASKVEAARRATWEQRLCLALWRHPETEPWRGTTRSSTIGQHHQPLRRKHVAELREYLEGTPFQGVIGNTIGESTPAWPVPPRARSGAPNVLFILLDDVGFAQLGCFGSDIHTPTFDRLAANGVRYRDFHTTAICSPTRSCLLTGRNHHSNGVGIIQEMATGFPGYNGSVPRENGFLSEILVREGYATFAVGKWHLTLASEYASGASKARWPLARGFERYYGFIGGKTSQWSPTLVADNHYISPPRSYDEGYHLNADLADKAIEFVTDLRAVSPDKPFFLYYCLGAGHAPHHVEQEWIDKYRGRFDRGWDRWRDEIFARQLDAGIVPPGTALPPRPEWIPAWDSLSDDEQRLYARQMEVYAAFLEQTDHHIGRVIDFLAEQGELDNTLIFATSDNGASAEGGPYGSFNELQFPNRVQPSVEENLKHLDEWGSVTSYPNYSWGWAWAGNTPLRRWKRYLHQGGMSDPLIVHWPKGIAAKGAVRTQYTHVVDVMPTVLDVLGIQPPDAIAGVPQKPIEGVSFARSLTDSAVPTQKASQYYEMIGSRAIWKDGWKAVTEQEQGVILTPEGLENQRWELYHVAEDFSECTDLADRHPEKLRELIDLWWAEARRYNVLPLDARMQARMAEPKPLAARETNRYVYLPGGAPQFEYTAVNVKNRSHTITAEVEIPAGGAEGVLLAHGSWFAGYALYLKDGRLHYVHNYLGLQEYRISSSEPVPSGAQTLRFEFRRTGEHQGVGTLFVGDRKIGEGEIPRTVPAVIETSGEGLCCGYDSGLPVTADYRAPFRFTGTLKRVVVDVDGPPCTDGEAQVRAAMNAQ